MAPKKRFISEAEEEKIIQAIRDAENKTSGEIRVHIEPTCKGEVFERAKAVFHQLEMDKTELHNGVLFYLAVEDHLFYVLGDSGIDRVVPSDFWNSTKDQMQTQFRAGKFAQGLIDGITKAGDQLKAHFPVADDDINELSDEISRG